MKYLLIAALALFSAMSTAAPVSAELSWTVPTTREDGTPISASELAGYRIYHAVDAAVSTDPESSHVTLTGGTSQVISIDLAPRVEPYTLRFGIRAVDTAGRISALATTSTTVRVASTAEPSAPTSVRIELNCTSGCVISVVE
jgi:hypothetical protein